MSFIVLFLNPDSSIFQFWSTTFGQITQDEELRQSFDVPRIFKHMARIAGAKNVNEFIRQPIQANVVPDEIVKQQLEAGNIIPVGA